MPLQTEEIERSILIIRGAGAIAATMLNSPFNFLADKEGFSKLATTREYVDVPGTAVVVHADKIETRPNTLKKFMRASLSAMKYIRDNRGETSQLIAREFSMDQEIAGLAYGRLLEIAQPGWQKSSERIPIACRLYPRRAKNRTPHQRRTAHR